MMKVMMMKVGKGARADQLAPPMPLTPIKLVTKLNIGRKDGGIQFEGDLGGLGRRADAEKGMQRWRRPKKGKGNVDGGVEGKVDLLGPHRTSDFGSELSTIVSCCRNRSPETTGTTGRATVPCLFVRLVGKPDSVQPL